MRTLNPFSPGLLLSAALLVCLALSPRVRAEGDPPEATMERIHNLLVQAESAGSSTDRLGFLEDAHATLNDAPPGNYNGLRHKLRAWLDAAIKETKRDDPYARVMLDIHNADKLTRGLR